MMPACKLTAVAASQTDGAIGLECPPIKLLYFHFHNAIRAELDALAHAVLALEFLEGPALLAQLALVKEQYQFLEQVYSIHSSVEDEVRYLSVCACAAPALESVPPARHTLCASLRGLKFWKRPEGFFGAEGKRSWQKCHFHHCACSGPRT